MKILFVLPRMVSGGVERVTLSLIAELSKLGHECVLALRSAHGELLGEARSLVPVHEVAPDGLHQFVPYLCRLIREWQPTHVVTAFADVAAMTWIAMRLAGNCPRWIHGVHNTHAQATKRKGFWGGPRYWLDARLASFIYLRADAVVAVSEGVRKEIVDWFHVAPQKVTTIYNPVVPEAQLREVQEPRHSPDQPFTIVAIGRLVHQKGFDTLITAMQDVRLPCRLDVWGDGQERQRLQALIAAQGMTDAIRLCGYTADPYRVLRDADLFVLPSRYEGLPTALIEALACQCQIVATDCPHGPREILQDGELGQLVPVGDVSALSGCIRDAVGRVRDVAPGLLLDRAREFTQTAAAIKWLQVMIVS